MSVFLLSFSVIAVAFLGMAVGVLFGRPPLNAGSCGQRGAGCPGTSCGFCEEGGGRVGARYGSIAHGSEQQLGWQRSQHFSTGQVADD